MLNKSIVKIGFALAFCLFCVPISSVQASLLAPKDAPLMLENEGVWSSIAEMPVPVPWSYSYHNYTKSGQRVYYALNEAQSAEESGKRIDKITLSDTAETRTPEITVGESDKKFLECAVYDSYLLWIEQEASGAWTFYAKDLDNNEQWVIDQSGNTSATVPPVYFNLEAGEVGYRCNVKDKSMQCVRIYNLKTRQVKTLYEKNYEENTWFYSPSVTADYVAWSLSTQMGDVSESGKVFVYSRKTGKTQTIKTQHHLVAPMVHGDYLIVREKPEGQNFIEKKDGYQGATIWCYNLKTHEWCFSLSNKLKPYQNKGIATLSPRACYKNLLAWDVEPDNKPFILVDMARQLYYPAPPLNKAGDTYHFLKFEDDYIYLTADKFPGTLYRAKLNLDKQTQVNHDFVARMNQLFSKIFKIKAS